MKRVPEEAPISDSGTPLRGSNSPNTSLGVEIGSVDSSFSNLQNQMGGASLSSTADHAEILGTSTGSRNNEFGGGRFQSSYSRPGYSQGQYSYTQKSVNYSNNTTASYDPCEPGTSLSVQHPSESNRSSYYDENLPQPPANVQEEKRFIQRASQSRRISHSRSANPATMNQLPPPPDVPEQTPDDYLLLSKTSSGLSWLRCFPRFMTRGRRMIVSLLISTLDRLSDLIVMFIWFTNGHFLWASLLAFIFFIAGIAQVSILYHHQKVRGARLVLNFFGIGGFGEAIRFLWLSNFDEETRRMRERRLKIRLKTSLSQKERRPALRFIEIRAIETLFETLPSGILQIYIAVLAPSKFHTINVISILASIIGLGYGTATSLVDYPDNEIRSVARKPKTFICIFLLVMGDILWRTVPVALFFSTYQLIPLIICTITLFSGHFTTMYFSRVADPFGPNPLSMSKLITTFIWSVPLCFNVTFSLFLVFVWGGQELCALRNRMLSYNCMWVFIVNITLLILVGVDTTSKTVFTWLMIAISGGAISYSGLYIVYREGEQIRKQWSDHGNLSDGYELNDVDVKQNELQCYCW